MLVLMLDAIWYLLLLSKLVSEWTVQFNDPVEVARTRSLLVNLFDGFGLDVFALYSRGATSVDVVVDFVGLVGDGWYSSFPLTCSMLVLVL